MRVFKSSSRGFPNLATTIGLVAGVLISGCGSERREPLPAEAKTPGELRVPKFPQDKQAIAKTINPNAPRSVKELQ